MHSSGQFVLAQINEIEKDREKTIAFCSIIGFRNEKGKLQSLKSPLDPDTEILKAEDQFIQEVLGLEEDKNKAYIGILDGRDNLKVYLDLNKVLTKHVTVLAKSGSGKSYTVAVLLEELLIKKIPVVIIDPHGEYSSLKYPNPKDKEELIKYGLKPQGFLKQVIEYSPDIETNPDAIPLKLSNKNMSTQELVQMLPTKLSASQLGLIYSALKNLGGRVDFEDLLYELESTEDSNGKWTLIDIFSYLKQLNLFSDSPTLMGELVTPGKMSIINLKGVDKDIQEIVTYKIINDLFSERKKNNIPPFFLVIEECHNFVPERSFGQAKSSAVIRQVAAEGRKFGLGLCLISQRPSRVDKSAISQASTQLILKVTNPNDVKAVSNSVEGITTSTERELQNIPIGTALVTGVVDIPLLVNIRPRMSKHGGEAITAFMQFNEEEKEKTFDEETKEFEEEGESLPIIKQQFNMDDIKVMHGDDANINHDLIPCALITLCKGKEDFKILIDLINLQIIDNVENVTGTKLLDLHLEGITPKEEKLLDLAIRMGSFKPADLLGRSGMQFADLYETINILTKKGYFMRDGPEFYLSKDMQFLSKIDKKRFYQPINYMRSKGNQLPTKYQYHVVKDFLNKFYEVKDIKECFIEKFYLVNP